MLKALDDSYASRLSRKLPPDTNLLETDAIATLLAAAPIALNNQRIIAVSGNSGCGKTVAIEVLASQLPQRVVTVTLDDHLTYKGVIEALYVAVGAAGALPALRHTRNNELMSHLRRRIAAEPVVLVLDEAQNAPIAALELARKLQEHPSANCGLIIAGAALDTKLAAEPMLDNRVGLRIYLEPLANQTLLTTLRQWNPLLAGCNSTTLLGADQAYGHGEWRRWTELVEWMRAVKANPAMDAAQLRIKLEQAVKFASGRAVPLP